MKNILCTLLASSLMLFSVAGCSGSNRARDIGTSENASTIVNAIDEQERSIGRIVDSTSRIREETENLTDTSTSVEDPQIASDILDATTNIEREVDAIEEQVEDLQETARTIDNTAPKIAETERQLEIMQEDETREAKQSLFGVLRLMFGLGALTVMIGVALSFFNTRLGLLVAGLGILTTAIAAAGTYYLQWIAIAGFVIIGVGILSAIGFLIWSLYKGRVRSTGFEVNTKLLEEMKTDLPQDLYTKYFDPEIGIASEIQPRVIRKEVDKVQKRLHQQKEQQESTEHEEDHTNGISSAIGSFFKL